MTTSTPQQQPDPPPPGYGLPHQQPYSSPSNYALPQQRQPRNGFGITALVGGLVGICLGIIPILGLVALIAGIIAVIFGLLGFGRARKGFATNKVMSIFGTAVGLAAAGLGIVGMVVVSHAFTDLNNTINGLAPTPAAPSAVQPGGTADPASPTGVFGQQVAWPDGVTVSMSVPKAYRPSQSAANTSSGVRFVSMVITVTNGTQKNLDSSLINVSATADGQNADKVYDSAQKIGGPPRTTILPGKSVTFDEGFGLTSANLADLQVEVEPAFGIGYQPAIFTGRA